MNRFRICRLFGMPKSRLPLQLAICRPFNTLLQVVALGSTLFLTPALANCVPPGKWSVPGQGVVTQSVVLDKAAAARVVLLGETHDNADHHRWQLSVVQELLHAVRRQPSGRRLIMGFEAFPRAAQPVLDRWVAGALGEEEFLKAVDWERIWGFDASLYLPLFRLARDERLPMLALNVSRETVRAVSARGLEAVVLEAREGIRKPAHPSVAYLDWLYDIYARHRRPGDVLSRADVAFTRFAEVQVYWDGAMAQALESAVSRDVSALVVGVIGSGHLRNGWGVPHQLAALGQPNVVTLLPWDNGARCEPVVRGVADAVFGIAAPGH